MNRNIYLILLIINFSCSSQTENNNQIIIPQNNEKVEIYLIDNLDDSRGYCLDMKGYKENADTSRNMQVHTCYSYQGEIAVDQGFNKGKISEKEFYISHFKVCLEAENIESSSTIELNSCDKNQKQKFFETGIKLYNLSWDQGVTVDLGYRLGSWFVAYLVDSHGEDKVYQFWETVDKASFEDTFLQRIGKDYRTYIDEFEVWLGQPNEELYMILDGLYNAKVR